MPASKDQQWKPEEDQLLRTMLAAGQSLKGIAMQFPSRSRRAIECRTYTLGLKSGTPRTVHSKNEAFWETPNALNCYYAGLAAADMSVDHVKHTLSWGCEHEDELYIDLFIQNTGFTGKSFRTTKINGVIGGRQIIKPTSIHSNLRVAACQQWHRDLARNFNVVPNKTHRLRPPNLETDLLKSCYLIGLLDGDGALSYSTQNMTPNIAYGSASRDIVEWVREFVESRFPYKMRATKTEVRELLDGHYYHYNVYGISAVKLIELFRTINVPKFTRKWENPILLKIIDRYHEKWPELFTPETTPRFNSGDGIVQNARFDTFPSDLAALPAASPTVAAA